MSSQIDRLKTLALLIKGGETADILKELGKRLYANDASIILRRDLSKPHVTPAISSNVRIRPLEQRDIPAIIKERPLRLPTLNARIPTCYVAVTADDSICYMQWLVGARDTDKLRPFFKLRPLSKGTLYPLASDEMLLEFAYTFEKFRGQGIMSHAMSRIAEKALEHGARSVITFVQQDNIASLKGCERAGFVRDTIRHERWRFCFCKEDFAKLHESSSLSPSPKVRQRANHLP